MNIEKTFKKIGNLRFITFEGIEGSGKSTQIKQFKEFLEKKGKKVYLFREPGGTTFGENLRASILNSEEKINPLAESLLFAASRTQLLHEKILPALQETDSVVIVDRYIDSSFAYQGVAAGLGINTVMDIHKHDPLNILPDLTFYLRIDLETSMKRQDERGNKKDYFEANNNEFYSKLIKGYDESSKIFKNRISIIDGTNDEKKVFKDLIKEYNRKSKNGTQIK